LRGCPGEEGKKWEKEEWRESGTDNGDESAGNGHEDLAVCIVLVENDIGRGEYGVVVGGVWVLLVSGACSI